jgi:hypothetical protein
LHKFTINVFLKIQLNNIRFSSQRKIAERISTEFQRLKEANRERERFRKHVILDHFNWTQSRFYFYSLQRRWTGNLDHNYLQMKYLNVLIAFLEEKSGLKIRRTNKRYQNGLLKYIDDHFEEFKPLLDSFSFSPTDKQNEEIQPIKKEDHQNVHPQCSDLQNEKKEIRISHNSQNLMKYPQQTYSFNSHRNVTEQSSLKSTQNETIFTLKISENYGIISFRDFSQY